MAVPKHLKIVFRGIFQDTPEQWSFSTKWDNTQFGAPDAGVDDVDVVSIMVAQQVYMNNPRFSNRVRATEMRIYKIGNDGLMEGNPRLYSYGANEEPIGTAGRIYSPDSALVVTTEAVNRGRARFGRFYLPMPGYVLENDCRLSLANSQDAVNAAVTFLQAVSNNIDLPQSTADAEMLNISAGAIGVSQVVNNIRVGRVLDRVERRRRQLLESYTLSGTIGW